jgi:hypothetical protein
LVVTSASANAQFQLQHRQPSTGALASDTAGFYVPANNPTEIRGIYGIEAHDELRVMMDDALTGTAWATIYATQVA